MAQILSDNDRGRLDKLVEEAEKSTNAQIVLAAVKRSDSYAELPWKAFALGASVAGLLVFYFDLLSPGWGSDTMVLVSVASILAAGAAFALLAIVLPVFGRLFYQPIELKLKYGNTPSRSFFHARFSPRAGAQAS